MNCRFPTIKTKRHEKISDCSIRNFNGYCDEL